MEMLVVVASVVNVYQPSLKDVPQEIGAVVDVKLLATLYAVLTQVVPTEIEVGVAQSLVCEKDCVIVAKNAKMKKKCFLKAFKRAFEGLIIVRFG